MTPKSQKIIVRNADAKSKLRDRINLANFFLKFDDGWVNKFVGRVIKKLKWQNV